MNDELTIVTGLSDTQRKTVRSWWASLPEVKSIEILQDGVQIYYQLKENHRELAGRTSRYCALILAARRNGWDTLNGKGYRVAEEQQFEDFSNIRKAKAAELTRRGRTPVLRKKILAYWGVVVEMKSEGHGFRPIAEYLLSAHKIKTSAVYLSRLWLEVQNG